MRPKEKTLECEVDSILFEFPVIAYAYYITRQLSHLFELYSNLNLSLNLNATK